MDVLLENGSERANKNDKLVSTKKICDACTHGHRRSCERPVDCPCVCQRITVVMRDEVAVLNARWESKLAKYVVEIEREAANREFVAGAEKAMAAVA